MNQGQFIKALSETTGVKKFGLSLNNTSGRAYINELYSEYGDPGCSEHYLLPSFYSDYFVKTLLPGEWLLFKSVDFSFLHGLSWLGGHHSKDLKGDFSISSPEIRNRELVTLLSPFPAGEDECVRAIITGPSVSLDAILELLNNTQLSPNGFMLGTYLPNDEGDNFKRLILRAIPNGRIALISKISFRHAGSQSCTSRFCLIEAAR